MNATPLADWLMRCVAARPAPGKADWAEAMAQEYALLESGRLGWAIGCMEATMVWNLRENAVYLLVLVALPLLLYWIDTQLFTVFAMHNRELLIWSVREGLAPSLLLPLPFAVALGAWRPDRIVTTTLLGGLLLHQIGNSIYNSLAMDTPFLSWWGPQATLYMAPPLIGLIASLSVWYWGGMLGRRLAMRLR
ncbi:hypothetical protein [Sphingomonas sp.]|uniref:hypothetical protein n=1 Tax=Sphingomonas sp. TaxID=28214 RepID=UPI001B2A4608|nr:hypothetical protein [Sphingomonas sp.]MBO9711383.1 hypothetical protein [Sphingomonas sp.]